MRRHELIWIAPKAWAEVIGLRSDLSGEPIVRDWAEREWPVIARRRLADEPLDRVPVGLPLPPSLGKRRIALSVSWEGVAARRAFLPLHCAVAAAPSAWRTSLSRILALGERIAVEPAVFGSLLWRRLTDLDYLTPTSDLDLLWPVPDGFRLSPLLEGLAAAEQSPRIDGEILLRNGAGINWRELRQALVATGGQVLAKFHDRASLVPICAIFDQGVAA